MICRYRRQNDWQITVIISSSVGNNEADNDESIEEIWNKQYALKPFLAPENFKSYDELKSKLDKVLSGVRNTGTAEDVAIPPAAQVSKPAVVEETVSAPTPAVEEDEDSDETLSYFSKLAEEDE